MIGLFLFSVAILLLTVAWLFLVLDNATRSLRMWRRVMSWAAVLALTVSLIDMLLGVIWVQENHTQELEILRRVVPTGFLSTGVAFLTCWFGTWKIVLCCSLSCLIAGFLWLMAIIGV